LTLDVIYRVLLGLGTIAIVVGVVIVIRRSGPPT
jgi:hypothetical protein